MAAEVRGGEVDRHAARNVYDKSLADGVVGPCQGRDVRQFLSIGTEGESTEFAGIVGPVFYLLLLTILGLLWTGYDPIVQSMSEIGGVMSPYKNIMNYLGFSLLGICIVSTPFFCDPRLRPKSLIICFGLV